MKKIRVALNGFGRIGRSLFRLLLNHPSIEVVGVNDLADAKVLAHLLKYDSIHGKLDHSIKALGNQVLVDEEAFPFYQQSNITKINWKEVEPDVVIECTGKFKTREELQNHIKGGASQVILSVPPKDDSIPMVVLGVTDNEIIRDEPIVSNASCTTNNAAPMLKIVHDNLQVEQAYISTIHSYT